MKKLVVVAAGIVAGLAFGAPAVAQTRPTVPVIVKDMTSPYWQAVLAGAREAGQDLGVNVVELGAQSEFDVSGQITILETAVTSADAKALNPMYRVGAAWMRTPVEDLTGEQFEVVKHWAVLALAAATVLATVLAAIIASLPERGECPGKLACTVRAMVAARRKTLHRIRERVRVEHRDRMRFVYVPVDKATGKILDPDVKHE